MTPSLDRAYFADIYDGDPDPWGFETRWYEQRKYALTMAALPEPRYRSAFEPGCSVGVLTALLAARCDRLVATELVPEAAERAARRLSGAPHVRIERTAIPESWPSGRFDLVVLSEIAYYFDAGTLGVIAGRVAESTEVGGTVVGVHWRGETNYPLTADQAHRAIGGVAAMERIVHHVEPQFLLDVWRRVA